MNAKLKKLLDRLHQVEHELGNPAIMADQKRYREITQEHSYLSELDEVWRGIQSCDKQIKENSDLLKAESDAEMQQMLKEDVTRLEEQKIGLEHRLQTLLVPPDPLDSRNTILELRAGTGGEEAALFVGDCVRMYRMYADRMGWRCEQLSATESDLGGYREYVMVLSGKNVYRYLRHEGGTHRVQRVPETEAQGRVHTSAITVAALLEPEESEEIDIDERDLRIDTYRSSGAGGQHVNTTDSAVRITHIPTGVVVYSQEERSQHKNKAKAMRVLQAKLVEAEQLKKEQAMASTRATQVGSGDRSERIRTYNFPQNRVTDHRINLTKHNLDQVMEGDLEDFSTALVADLHQRQLTSTQ